MTGRKLALATAGTVSAIISSESVMAHCPLCTAAVGAAAVSATYFGLDASIVGVFVGAIGVSLGLWFGKIIKKRYVKFQTPLIVAASFLLTVIPLLGVIKESLYLPALWFGPPGSVLNRIYFVDKLLLGSVLGALASFAAYWLHVYVKKIHGRVVVPYQGVIFTVGMLLFVAAILFLAIGG